MPELCLLSVSLALAPFVLLGLVGVCGVCDAWYAAAGRRTRELPPRHELGYRVLVSETGMAVEWCPLG